MRIRDLKTDEKRLFFGAHVQAAWPLEFPFGRMIPEEARHITLAFLGNNSFSSLEKLLPGVPEPLFRIGLGGIGSKLVFLSKEHARCAALHISWLEDAHVLFAFQKELTEWLSSHRYPVKKHAFCPHITIARAPFEKEQWMKRFEPIPFFLSAIHLYESVGGLQYRSLWSHPLLSPFTELDHTADIAFTIRGESIQQLFLHAQLALFFQFPLLAQFYTPLATQSLNEITFELNRMIALADSEYGCPFKAVSLHGKVIEENHLFTWEMIVDV
jgi:2'-5' RNA ligase